MSTQRNDSSPVAAISYSMQDLIVLVTAAEGVTLNERTVRQYMADGLLPAPAARGGTMPYGEEHLLHLRLVARLAAQYVPARELQRFVGRLSPESVRALVDRPMPARLPSEGDAQAYLGRLSCGLPSPLLAQGLFTGALTASGRASNVSPLPRGIGPAPGKNAPARERAPREAAPSGQVTRSPWLRVTIEPDVEISIRANGHDQKRLVDALVSAVLVVLARERDEDA